MPILLTPLSPTDSIIYSSVEFPTLKTVYTTPDVQTSVIQTQAITTYPTTFINTQPLITTSLNIYPEIDTGIDDSMYAQKQMTKYILYRMLDHHLYKDKLRCVLKYMKVNGKKVEFVKNKTEYEKNDINNDSDDDVEMKKDYIENNLLSIEKMRNLLIKIIDELQYKWKNLSRKKEEEVIVGVVKRYLTKEFERNFLS